jgi:outer membrane biosynthesis protein TonB
MPDDNFTPIPEPMPAPKAKPKPKLKQAPKPAPPPKEPKIAVSVQPMKQVSQKLLLKLQTVVNEMQKGGIDKLIVDRAGSIQVTFAPVEQMFDLEQG